MKKQWVEQADRVGNGVKEMPGQLVGVSVDDDAKADAFVKHWKEHHPHIEVIDRNPLLGSVFMRIRLKGSVQ